MGNNHIESENASSQDFIKERIKARPVNKAKLMRRMAGTILSAIIFGFVFCLCYRYLHKLKILCLRKTLLLY